MKKYLFYITFFLVLLFGCRKDDSYVVADFSYEITDTVLFTDTVIQNDTVKIPVGIKVRFINNSHGGLDFLWNFGDSASINYKEYSPVHIYNTHGQVSVTLTVTGNYDVKKITKIVALPDIKPNFEIVYLQKDSIVIKNTSEYYYGMDKFYIDWGDGDSISDNLLYNNKKIGHRYNNSGIYDVRFIIDKNFKQYIIQKSISISDFLVDFFMEQPRVDSIIVTDSTENKFGTESVDIDWGDGKRDEGIDINDVREVSHVYENGGDYRITYNVKRGEETGIAIKTVSLPGLSADFSVEMDGNVFTYSFEGFNKQESFGNIDYFWDFGDGKDTTGKQVTHTFKNGGIHNVTLNLQRGNEKSIITKSIELPTLRVNFKYNVDPDVVGRVTFENTSSFLDTVNGNEVKVIWDFGNGETDTVSIDTTSTKYSRGGIYMVTLQITQGIETRFITKAVNVPTINAAIGVIDSARLKIFKIDPHDNIVSATVIWDFGDGEQRSYQVPTDKNITDTVRHFYQSTGTKLVRLTIQQGADVPNFSRSVNSYDPLFTDSINCPLIAPLYVTCYDATNYPYTPIWNSVSSADDSVIFMNNNSYKVKLKGAVEHAISMTFNYPDYDDITYSKTYTLSPLSAEFTDIKQDTSTFTFSIMNCPNIGSGENLCHTYWLINDSLWATDISQFTHTYNDNDTVKALIRYNGESASYKLRIVHRVWGWDTEEVN